MTNTAKRIITATVMVLIAGLAAWFGLVRYVAITVVALMAWELFAAMIKSKKKIKFRYWVLAIIYSCLMISAANTVGAKPWVMLLLLMIISAADTGGWFFGKKIGGDKMWPNVSPNKTWAGQIAGIVCGATAGVLYGLLGTDVFLPALMWIGIGVALLSQYGDLTASGIKRYLGIKDFSNLLPGHGGLMDRFDGWIFVLPIVWFAIL